MNETRKTTPAMRHPDRKNDFGNDDAKGDDPETGCAFARGNEAIEAAIRREVLRDVFEALSPDAAWQRDDRFEHYPFDVQAIAQLAEDRCRERLKEREQGLTNKLKSAHEKELKALTQRCLKDKQAARIEAEADKKAMGLEIARVKKRLIEVEREKHQATCRTAQLQRDGRHMKTQIDEAEAKVQELQASAKKKTERLQDLDKSHAKYKQEREEEAQKMKEQILNLEAKLNNQEAHWSDRCCEVTKNAEIENQKVLRCLKEDLEKRCTERVAEELRRFENRLCAVIAAQKDNVRQLTKLKEQIGTGYSRQSKIQRLFRDSACEDIEFMRTTLRHCGIELRQMEKEKKALDQSIEETQSALARLGVSTIHEIGDQINTIKDLLEKERERSALQDEALHQMQSKLEQEAQNKEENEKLIGALQQEVQTLQCTLDNLNIALANCQKEHAELSHKCAEVSHEKEEIAESVVSLNARLMEESQERMQAETEKQGLVTKMDALQLAHSSEIDALQQSKGEALVMFLQELKMKFFQLPLPALDNMVQSMMDATTQSCIRSLKLTSQLRSTGVPRKRIGSAIHSIMTRIKSNLDHLVNSVDLEDILSHAQLCDKNSAETRSEPKGEAEEAFCNKSEGTRSEQQRTAAAAILNQEDVKKEVMEIECCIFWLILDAKIKREQCKGEQRESHQTAFSRASKRKVIGSVPSLNRLRTERRALEKQKLKSGQLTERGTHETTPDLLELQKSEAEEINEIIEVLKEYLKNKNHDDTLSIQETPILDTPTSQQQQ